MVYACSMKICLYSYISINIFTLWCKGIQNLLPFSLGNISVCQHIGVLELYLPHILCWRMILVLVSAVAKLTKQFSTNQTANQPTNQPLFSLKMPATLLSICGGGGKGETVLWVTDKVYYPTCLYKYSHCIVAQ